MALSFGGISTGIPTDQLIESILSQEAAPLNRLQARQTANTQKKNILQSIKTALTNLTTSISALNSSALNARKVTSSDSSFITATAKGGAAGSYDMVVDQLATKARFETTNYFANPDASVGNADGTDTTYTIVGKDGTATNILLEAGKTSLADLNNAINAESATTGVSSTIVQKKPGEYHLVLSSTETGEAKKADGTPGPNTVSISGGTLGGGTSVAAENAKFTLNGVAMERASNTFDDAVDGVTFTLNNKTDGKNVNLSVTQDTDAVVKAFQDVVSKFNAAYTAYKNASGKGGVLAGDLSLQSMFSQLRSTITGLNGGNPILDGNGDTWNAITLGIKTERDGTMSLDTKMLEEALKTNPDLVGKVFDRTSSATKTFVDSLTSYGGGTLTNSINSLDTMNSNLSKQIDNIQARLDRRRETLTAQFARLESLIGQMQSAGQSLSALY